MIFAMVPAGQGIDANVPYRSMIAILVPTVASPGIYREVACNQKSQSRLWRLEFAVLSRLYNCHFHWE